MLGPKPRRQGQNGKVQTRMEKALRAAVQVTPPRVVRNSNKKPRNVARRKR